MPEERGSIRSAVLVTGFGTTVAMWGTAYLCRLPLVQAPAPLLGALLLLCLVLGGASGGRETGSWLAGLLAGLLSAVLNFLILGSLLSSPEKTNEVVPSALLWIPGFLVASAVLGAGGGLLGARRTPKVEEPSWTGRFALVAATATLLLIVAGGLVTGEEAGMAVYDWPTTEEYNMFLYPVSRMTGGIYYEHAHRLFGTLLGLASIVLAVRLWATDTRKRVKLFGSAVLLVVVVQGLLGGFRVTEDSLALAVSHGVLGQLILAAILGIAAATSRTWLGDAAPKATAGAGTDRMLGWALLVLSTVQVLLGALVRHFDTALHPHLAGAVVVFFLGVFAGFRAWGLHGDQEPIRKTGLALIVLFILQLALGFAALIVSGATRGLAERPPIDVLLTTAHQAAGSLILAAAALLAVWSHRLLTGKTDGK